MIYILYNAKSHNETSVESLEKTLNLLKGKEVTKISVFDISSYEDFFAKMKEGDMVYLLGGDGTISHFVNDVYNIDINVPVYYFGAGTGNDFMTDIKEKADENGYVLINDYIKNLPTCYVKGESYKFVNGIGYGLDGECVAVADDIQSKKPGKAISYPVISVKLLLITYKTCDVTVIVDGVEHHFKKAWLAPTMKGRYYGGGLMVAPSQDRKNGKVSCVVIHNSRRLPTLFLFLSIFKGEHVKKVKKVSVLEGKEIKVKFSQPRSLQVDGELIRDVIEYSVKA